MSVFIKCVTKFIFHLYRYTCTLNYVQAAERIIAMPACLPDKSQELCLW